jgi:hypothetical protein
MEIPIGSSPPSSSPAAIRPGKTLAFSTMVITFPLSLSENTSRQGDLGFGLHYVELEFEVWNVSEKHFIKVHSQPVEVTIREVRGLKPCSDD